MKERETTPFADHVRRSFFSEGGACRSKQMVHIIADFGTRGLRALKYNHLPGKSTIGIGQNQHVRMLIETEDTGIINQIKAIFEGRLNKGDIWDEWDSEVRKDVEEAIRQADAGDLIPHDKAITMLKTWV